MRFTSLSTAKDGRSTLNTSTAGNQRKVILQILRFHKSRLFHYYWRSAAQRLMFACVACAALGSLQRVLNTTWGSTISTAKSVINTKSHASLIKSVSCSWCSLNSACNPSEKIFYYILKSDFIFFNFLSFNYNVIRSHKERPRWDDSFLKLRFIFCYQLLA